MCPTQTKLQELENDFFDEEIKRAIWDLGQDKVSGPDGFQYFFFQTFWSSIKQDFINLFKELNNGGAHWDRLNYFFIVLIPKKTSPESISEYYPIALMNSVLKIFSKVLASRLTPHLQKIIGDTQTNFIAGRNILYRVAIVQEVIHHCRKTDKEGYRFKA